MAPGKLATKAAGVSSLTATIKDTYEHRLGSCFDRRPDRFPLSLRAPSACRLLDVERQYRSIERDVTQAIQRVCESGRFVLGPDCEQLEQALASYCQVPHAVACASGSDALLLALMAYDVGPGDEVLMPSYTFFATASAAWRLGAKPVFVDIEPTTFNINPRLIEVAHHAGHQGDRAGSPVRPVRRHAGDHDDRTAAPFAGDRGRRAGDRRRVRRRRAGSWGEIGCFSFYPTKNLGGFGDGGLLTTKDPQLAERLRLLRAHGMQPRYYHQVVGINSRLDTLQAAVLNVKLTHLEEWTAERQANARRYGELFAAAGLDRVIGLPLVAPAVPARLEPVRDPRAARPPRRAAGPSDRAEDRHRDLLPDPAALAAMLRSRSATAPGSLPESERAARETLALPIFAELTADRAADGRASDRRVFRDAAAWLRCVRRRRQVELQRTTTTRRRRWIFPAACRRGGWDDRPSSAPRETKARSRSCRARS